MCKKGTLKYVIYNFITKNFKVIIVFLLFAFYSIKYTKQIYKSNK